MGLIKLIRVHRTIKKINKVEVIILPAVKLLRLAKQSCCFSKLPGIVAVIIECV